MKTKSSAERGWKTRQRKEKRREPKGAGDGKQQRRAEAVRHWKGSGSTVSVAASACLDLSELGL